MAVKAGVPPRWPQRLGRLAVSVVFLPVSVVVLVATMLAAVPLVLYAAVREKHLDRRFWRRVRGAGRLANWSEIHDELTQGHGVLVIDMGPGGWSSGAGYWLPDEPTSLDPEANCPRWSLFETHPEKAMVEMVLHRDRMHRWSQAHLGPRLAGARFAHIPNRAIASQLDADTKRNRVFIVWIDDPSSLDSLSTRAALP